jgi:small nuclear ribonucleoprotein (snRNP)-like protein
MSESNVLVEEEETRRAFLKKYLNKTMRVKITDGRILIGTYLCTDKDANIVLGACKEYQNSDSTSLSFFILISIQVID